MTAGAIRGLGFIGAGSMAEALIQGVISTGLAPPGRITVTNRRDHGRLEALRAKYGVCVGTKEDVAKASGTIIIAVKPKDMAEALSALREFLDGERHLLISVAAGVSTSFIESIAAGPGASSSKGMAVIRAMPNVSSAVQESATAISAGAFAGDEALGTAAGLFHSVGEVVFVEEGLLDAVTALSGSGPAYVYYLIEAMEKAGLTLGLAPDTARRLAAQTVFGASKLLLSTGAEPSDLRAKVTSPGGTTMAAIESLAESGFQQAVGRAVARAAERSRELGAAFSP